MDINCDCGVGIYSKNSRYSNHVLFLYLPFCVSGLTIKHPAFAIYYLLISDFFCSTLKIGFRLILYHFIW